MRALPHAGRSTERVPLDSHSCDPERETTRLCHQCDTGTARTVVSLSRARELGLVVEALARCGAGAGGSGLGVFQISGAELRLGDTVPRLEGLLALDLGHVNEALAQKCSPPVDVVLGVDVFDAHAAVIDYGSASLFLREA